MTTSFSNEVFWLTLTILMTSLLWVPYIINRMHELGVLNALWDRYGNTTTKVAWAHRMMDAHVNAVENLVIFAPLVLLIQISGLNSTLTTTACMVYFFARLTHYVVYTFALPLLRVASFLTGFGAQFTLVAVLLGF